MDSETTSSTLSTELAISPALFLGLVLLAAIIGGHAAHFFHIPRVIGFLLAGVILQTALTWLCDPENGVLARRSLDEAADLAETIKQVALGLILFMIGGVFERSRLRASGARVLRISGFEIGATFLLVCTGCWIGAVVMQPQYGAGTNFIFALLLAIAALATAPAATMFVLQEYQAKGPITETTLGLTGINNIVCIVLFYTTFLVLASVGAIETTADLARHMWSSLAAATVGSIVLGVLGGTLLSIVHSRLPIAETLLVFLAVFVSLGAGEALLLNHLGMSYNSLLTALVIGGIFANLARDVQKLEAALHTLGAPLFACFFVLAGYALHIGDLARMGWIGLAYVVCRSAGKVIGCNIGVRVAGGPQRTEGQLGAGLLCQAAVVIGLASFVQQNWDSELGRQFATIVLGSIVAFELVGPLLVKRRVVRAGEVKAATLLRREGAAGEGVSITAVILRSLRTLLRRPARLGPGQAPDLTVQHIMRTNVELIPASATFDEVLYFVERSRFSHFPVVHDDGTLFGMVHFSDLHDLIYDPAMADLVTALDIADPESAVVPMDLPLSDLLNVFTSHHVGVLTVVESQGSRHIVGLVEQRDLLRTLRLMKRENTTKR